MKCLKPFVAGKAAFGCGQCMPCRFNRRRTWMHRILLEGTDHAEKSFVTLTYSDDPTTLDPNHTTLWLKKIRKRVSPQRLRYFLVGEYGDKSQRPHYHVALFGWPPCQLQFGSSAPRGDCKCYPCTVVRETWGHGHVMLGTLEPQSAQYIAGYVTKKMTQTGDPRLGNRHPEFARMSLWPGIGANAMFDVASALMRYSLDGRKIPDTLTHANGRALPLGRYLRKKLSQFIGLSDEEISKRGEETLSRLYEELSLVREFAMASDRSVASVYEEVNQPYANHLAAKLKSKRRSM